METVTATPMDTLTSNGRDRPAEPAVEVSSNGYVLPFVHTRLSERTVNIGFWVGLGVAVALGAVDPPVAALIGVGVAVARHQRKG